MKKIRLEASGCHVHVCGKAVEALFGPGAELMKRRELSQPGEFVCEQRVKLVSPAGVLENVAVLGPVRPHTQVELSLTDCRKLGINAPINLSGDLSGAADVLLVGDQGEWKARESVIVAKNHIHFPPETAREFGVADGQKLQVLVQGARPVIFQEVPVRVKENFAPAMHIDFDEANSCDYRVGTEAFILLDSISTEFAVAKGEVLVPMVRRLVRQILKEGIPERIKPELSAGYQGKLITEEIARELIGMAKDGNLYLSRRTLVTPSAKDIFLRAKVGMIYLEGHSDGNKERSGHDYL